MVYATKLERNKKIKPKGRNSLFGRILKSHLTKQECFDLRYIPEPNSGCWLWIMSGPNGYGYFVYKRKQKFAHRSSWELHKGEIPDGLFVCHKCDVRCCVNPNHLFLGTALDNNRDMMKKGRNKPPCKPKKLNEEKVKEIFYAIGFYKDIAKNYNIHQRMVGMIKNRQVWKNVTEKL